MTNTTEYKRKEGVPMKYEETAKRLKKALSNAGFSAIQLSEMSGVNRASISQYVNGVHIPSNINSAKIAKVLDVSPVWLMGFDVPMREVYVVQSESNNYTQTITRLKNDEQMLSLMSKYYDMGKKDKKFIYNMLEFLINQKCEEQ